MEVASNCASFFLPEVSLPEDKGIGEIQGGLLLSDSMFFSSK